MNKKTVEEEYRNIYGRFRVNGNYVNGVLFIYNNGLLSLNLFNVPDSTSSKVRLESLSFIEYLDGYSGEGRYFEIFDCYNFTMKFTNTGITISYKCRQIIEYENYEASKIKYNSFLFDLDKFNQWLDFDFGENGSSSYKNIKLSIVQREKKSLLCLELQENKPTDFLKNALSYYYSFLNLMMLTIEDECVLREMAIQDAKNTTQAKIYLTGICPSCSNFISQTNLNSIIKLSDIKNDLSKVLYKLNKEKEELQASLSAISKKINYQKIKKLDSPDYVRQTATAIEGFMGNIRKIKKEDNEADFKSRIERIYENQTDSDLLWLKERLKYANEATLRKKTKELLEEVQEKNYVEKFSNINKETIDKFVGCFVTMRNYYTHYSIEDKSKIVDVESQVRFCDLINELLRLVLLNEIGIDEKTIREHSSNNKINQLIEICLKKLDVKGEKNG